MGGTVFYTETKVGALDHHAGGRLTISCAASRKEEVTYAPQAGAILSPY